jgi:hypothetical protein
MAKDKDTVDRGRSFKRSDIGDAVADLMRKRGTDTLSGFDPAITSSRQQEPGHPVEESPALVNLAPVYRRLQDGKVWVWREGWGQQAYVLYSMLGLDGGIETALRAQAKIPVRDQSASNWTQESDMDDDKAAAAWAAFVPAVCSITFARDVVTGVMHTKTKRGSAITDLESLARSTAMALSSAYATATFEMRVYVTLLVQIYFTSLQLVVEPENEVVFTEERPRVEVTRLSELHFAIMCGATANAAIGALTRSMAALPEWVMIDIVQSGLQRFVDAFVRARANYYEYILAIETMLGMLRFSLASGAEPTFASTSQAYCLLKANACAIRVAQSTLDLPAPPMIQTDRWVMHSELALDALDVMDYELEAVEKGRYQSAHSAFRGRFSSYFSVGPAGVGDRPSMARTAPAGVAEVLRIAPETSYDSGLESCWAAIAELRSEQNAARLPAAYDGSMQGRYGWTDVCGIGIGSQIILALSLCESFQTFYPAEDGLKKVRPSLGFTPEAVGQYMSRTIIFGYIVAGSAVAYQGHDAKVIGSALGTIASAGLLTTFSPWAAIRATMPGGIGQPLSEEKHLGKVLQKPRPVRLLAEAAVARAEIDPREWMRFSLQVIEGDGTATFPERAVRLGRFLFGDVVMANDERIYMVGSMQQHTALWHTMITHYVQAADALATGRRRTFFKSVVAEGLRKTLLSQNWGHQLVEMTKKVAAYASRYSTEIDVAATVGSAARASAVAIFLDILGLSELAPLMQALLAHEQLQTTSEVQDTLRDRLLSSASFQQA